MSFPISAALLDAIVLSVVAQEPEGTYGYKITQQVTHTLELSESTLYPVLRRLQKDQLLGAAPVAERPAAHGLRCALQWPQPPLLSDHLRRAGAACRLRAGVEPLPFFH